MTKRHHVGRPAPCTDCIDMLLEFAETLKGRDQASIFCPHSSVYVTVAMEDGAAVQWRTTGPITFAQAKELHDAGQVLRREAEAALMQGRDDLH